MRGLVFILVVQACGGTAPTGVEEADATSPDFAHSPGLPDLGRPTDLDPTPAPDLTPRPDLGGTLDVSSSVFSGTVDLTAEGSTDWAHWGFHSNLDIVNRKAAVSPLINAVAVGSDPLHQFTDSAIDYTWSDGTPTGSSDGTHTGIFILGVGNGFRLSVPADPNARTLSIYLSSYAADFRVIAHLSDGSSPDHVEDVANATNDSLYKRYTFAYKSLQPGQTLEVTWVTLNEYFGGGNVTLEAATLQ